MNLTQYKYILVYCDLTFFPRTVPATYGLISGRSGVSRACLLICSISFFLFNGPVASLLHS